MSVGIGTDGSEHIAGFCAPGTVRATVSTLMTKEDIGVGHQSILESPLGENHFLAGKWIIISGQGADNGAGGALITFFKGIAASLLHLADKFEIGLYIHCDFLSIY